MNILFVHEVDWFKKVVFEMHDWAELLSKRGHNVYIVDFEDSWKRTSFFDLGYLKSKEFSRVFRVYEDGPVDVIRPGFIKLPLIDRVSAYFLHYREIKRIIVEKSIDVVLLYSVPTNGRQTIKVTRKYKIPVVFRSIDILHELVPNFYKKQTFKMERYVYANVEVILALTPKLKEYVIKMGAEPKKVDILFFGVNTNRFHPDICCRKLKEELGIEKQDKVILYIGTFFEFSGLDMFIYRMPLVIKKFPNAKLLLVGGGVLEKRMKQIVEKLNIENNVIFTGFRPFKEMPKFINLSDVCINPFQPCNATRDIIPGKLFQYLACRKPIVSLELPGIKSVLKDEKYGIVHCKNMDEFIQQIILLLEDENKRKDIATMGYKYVCKHHNLEEIVKRVEKVIYKERRGDESTSSYSLLC